MQLLQYRFHGLRYSYKILSSTVSVAATSLKYFAPIGKILITIDVETDMHIADHSRTMSKWGGPSDKTGKTEVPCRSRCGTIKIPPCSKALSAELF
jgi:hypothetical protein